MAKVLKISDFRSVVTFQENVVVSESRYEDVSEWYDVYEDRAKVETVQSVENASGENPFPIVTHRMYTRYRSSINPTYRVLVDGIAFRVTRVNEMEFGQRKYHEWILDQEKTDI